VSPFDGIEGLDLAVDGADEIDPSLNLIKGGGGALLREKIVAMASTRFCIIADRSKRVEKLGAFPLPVEVVDFGLAATLKMIEAAASEAGCYGEIKLRQDQFGEPFVTDGGHFIADCAFRAIRDAEALSAVLQIIPGVVEHGLFIGLADDVFIAGPEGVTHLKADEMS
jgi:ribose 5-phosphate isomerase A